MIVPCTVNPSLSCSLYISIINHCKLYKNGYYIEWLLWLLLGLPWSGQGSQWLLWIETSVAKYLDTDICSSHCNLVQG